MERQAEALMRGQLISLALFDRDIGDDGAEIVADFLKHDETVRGVFLSSCLVGLLGIKAIAEALMHNKTVENMQLFCNSIGDRGAEALINALNYNVCIKGLAVLYSHVSDSLMAQLKYLTETRNKILVPSAVRRVSLSLIAARRTFAGAGTLSCFPKEIVEMIAIKVWATRNHPEWLLALTESERTASVGD